MKKALLLVVVFALTLGGVSIAANLAEDAKPKAPAGEPLAAEHKDLAKRAGSWAISGNFFDKDTGKATTVSGEATIELVLGERFLYEENNIVTADGNACAGRGFIGFNPADKSFQVLYLSEKMNGMKVMNGAYDAKLKSVVYAGTRLNAENTRHQKVRVVVRDETDDKFVVEFYCEHPAPEDDSSPRDALPKKGAEHKEGELIYTRK